jgi:hypothetical protein
MATRNDEDARSALDRLHDTTDGSQDCTTSILNRGASSFKCKPTHYARRRHLFDFAACCDIQALLFYFAPSSTSQLIPFLSFPRQSKNTSSRLYLARYEVLVLDLASIRCAERPQITKPTLATTSSRQSREQFIHSRNITCNILWVSDASLEARSCLCL